MQYKLDNLDYDIDDSESEIREIISKNKPSDENIQRLCFMLESVIGCVFSSLDKDSGMRGWTIDDFRIEELNNTSKKSTYKGHVYWLDGGVDCELFQVDIAKDTKKMLYSFKFYKGSRYGSQTLYIGKTDERWVIHTKF